MKHKIIAGILLLFILGGAGAFFLIKQSRPGELILVFPELSRTQKGFIDPLATAFQIETGIRVRYTLKEAVRIYEDLESQEPEADLYYLINNRQLEELDKAGKLSEIKLRHDKDVAELFYSNSSYMPVSWYPWGVYYNRELFIRLGVEEPVTPEDLQGLEKKAEEAGYPLYSLMNKIKWPAALLFDYLDLQINGLEFHKKLLAGEIPFTDKRVKTVFLEILRLHQKGAIYMESDSTDWKSLISALSEGRNLMLISGSFFREQADPEIRDNLGWIPFPGSTTLVAASSGFVIPPEGKNRRAVKKFLEFILSEKGQEILQRNSNLIAVNSIAASRLERPDINTALDSLEQYDALIPSFERYCLGSMTVPFKSALNSLYAAIDEKAVDEKLASLESMRLAGQESSKK